MKKGLNIIVFMLVVLVFATCKKMPDAPDFSNKIEFGTTKADTVLYFNANISSEISQTGGNEIVNYGHCWSTDKKPSVDDNKTSFGKLNKPVTFKSEMENLTDNTIYYIRPYVTYSYGTLYGDEQSITTLKTGKPKVTTAAVTNITTITAQCGGVNDNGGYTVTQRGVCWNKTGNPTLGNSISHTNESTGTGAFSSQITGLTDNTTYYVTAYATNEKGTSYGSVITFTTLVLTLPTVTTNEISNITATSAISGGNVTNDGNGTVSARGICWNTTGNPTLGNSIDHTTNGTGTGSFTSQITGLIENTTYYVTAYATNEKGSTYGQEKSFVATNDFIDPRDGQRYKTVIIGNQTWMAENLNYETTDSWWYDNSSTNGDVYGRLYTWDAALTACPGGWHLPSDEEWKTMEMALGMSKSEADKDYWRGTDEGKKMKSISGWNEEGNGTNTSDFTAFPGGYFDSDTFYYKGYSGYWWTSSEVSGMYAWYRYLDFNSDMVYRNNNSKRFGFSVRCIKD